MFYELSGGKGSDGAANPLEASPISGLLEASPISTFLLPFLFYVSRFSLPVTTVELSKFQEERKTQEYYKRAINAILERRLLRKSLSQRGVTAVFGEPNFLPFSSLELGKIKGEAVGRLVRRFSSATATLAAPIYYEILLGQKDLSQITAKEASKEMADFLIPYKKYRDEFETKEFVKDFEKLVDDLLAFIRRGSSELELKEKRNNIIDKIKNILIDNAYYVPIATTFLVGRSHILTNYHVFLELVAKNKEDLFGSDGENIDFQEKFVGEYYVQLGFEHNIVGRRIEPTCYQLDRIIMCDRKLDYALISLKETAVKSDDSGEDIDAVRIVETERAEQLPSPSSLAGDLFGYLIMDNDDRSISPSLERVLRNSSEQTDNFDLRKIFESIKKSGLRLGQDISLSDREILNDLSYDRFKDIFKAGEPVIIIQHPRGRRKEIVLSGNLVIEIFKDYIWYQADADFGSSGSPVFNQQWQLVAMQNAVVPVANDDGTTATFNNGNFRVAAEQGVMIASIVNHLLGYRSDDPQAGESSNIKDLITKFDKDNKLSQDEPSLLRKEDIMAVNIFIDNFVNQVDNLDEAVISPLPNSPVQKLPQSY
jgi:hypothetical protein